MAYEDSKDLPRRTDNSFDKVLRDKVFHVAKHPIYHGYQRGMALMTFNFFEKMSATHKGAGINFNAVSDKYCLNKRITQVNC